MKKETRLDKRKAETKAKIFKAAVELFLEQGYEITTIEQIVEKADVAKGTFFIHFPTKKGVIYYLGEQRVALMEKILAEKLMCIKSAREKIFSLLNVLAEVNEENKEITGLITKEIFKELFSEMNPEKENQMQLKMMLVKILADGQHQGEFHRDFNPVHAADIIISIYFYTLFQWLDGWLSRPLAEEFSDRVKIIMAGIAFTCKSTV